MLFDSAGKKGGFHDEELELLIIGIANFRQRYCQ
jgi:hypothetical protein